MREERALCYARPSSVTFPQLALGLFLSPRGVCAMVFSRARACGLSPGSTYMYIFSFSLSLAQPNSVDVIVELARVVG